MLDTPTCTNVRVLLRIRPFNDREVSLGSHTCINTKTSHNNTIELLCNPVPKQFTYDSIADSTLDQNSMFQLCGHQLVEQCLQGYNGTIFAYGQTGSGKSYTISGNDNNSSRHDLRGLMPRVFEYLYQSINDQPNVNKKFTIKVSFIEIYQEKIYDLLDTTNSNNSLVLREDIKFGVFVEHLSEHAVTSVHDCIQLMHRGNTNRRVGETAMNRNSSRSHSVFTINIQSTEIKSNITTSTSSKFNLIDLAGSESQKRTQTTGAQLKEASQINQSLSALGML